MNKLLPFDRQKLIDELAAKTGCSEADAGRQIEALIEIVTARLQKCSEDALVGVGEFGECTTTLVSPNASLPPGLSSK